MRAKKEILVAGLVILAVGLMGAFAYLMGVFGPFSGEVKYHLLYAFAGGVEVGSAVRVSGVKVGKVDKIEFIEGTSQNPANLKLSVSVSQKAAPSVREDSKFYINMAGIIGERYIEVSPGSPKSAVLKANATVRGVDPPRIDQLLSQGYNVFGKLQEFIDENEGPLSDFVKEVNHFLVEANQLLKGKDRKKLLELVENLTEVTGHLKRITKNLDEPRAKEFMEKILDLVRRAHDIDKPTLKKFLQEEGIRARIF